MSLGVVFPFPIVPSSLHSAYIPSFCDGKGISREKSRAFVRLSSSTDALIRHKKWLKDIEAQRITKKAALEEQSRIKLERKRKFKISQAKKRKDYKIEAQANFFLEDNCHANNPEEEDQVNEEARVGGNSNKPPWALTESSAQNKVISQKAAEEEDLLNFIESLDLESFYQDMELNILVNHLKDRIRKLEADRQLNEDRLEIICDREIDIENRNNVTCNIETSKNNFAGSTLAIKDRENKIEPPNDTGSIVSSVLNERGKEFLSIHSRKSMTRLILKSHEKLESQQSNQFISVPELELRPPIVVNHRDDDGARIAETKNLNKLPFKNRNPAV